MVFSYYFIYKDNYSQWRRDKHIKHYNLIDKEYLRGMNKWLGCPVITVCMYHF